MAIVCPRCGRQYDVTLFEFGISVTCDCGEEVNPFVDDRARLGNRRPAPRTYQAVNSPRSSKSRHISSAASRKDRRGA